MPMTATERAIRDREKRTRAAAARREREAKQATEETQTDVAKAAEKNGKV